MFEHVGVGHYATSSGMRDAADDDGVMLLHSIGRSDGPSVTNPWIAKYIFPGGYVPAVGSAAVDRARGPAGHRYRNSAPALRRDAEGLARAFRRASRAKSSALYDERFCRMWEFYLAASEMAFRKQAMMVFQLQLARRQGVVPTTRDYIAREDRATPHAR